MPKKHTLEAISTLIGFTIGAGILGIPFVVAKAGFLTGILNIITLGILILILNLYIGEISLRTRGNHQLTGYAKIYLGKAGNLLMTASFMIFSYGALIAYIIKTGEFLNVILNPLIGGSAILYSILFFTISFIIIHKGIKIIEKSEVSMVILILIIIIVLSIIAIPHIKTNNLSNFNINNFFVPYGIVLFAFLATAAVPEINEELGKNKKELKKIIIIGTLIPLMVYVLFALVIVGMTGTNTSDGSIMGLGQILGHKILILGSTLGILTMATSFIAVAFAVSEMYRFDYGLKKRNASNLACIAPLIISLLIINSNIKNAFFKVLDVAGSFGGSLAGILIVMIWWKSKTVGKRKPEYSLKKNIILPLILISMFILGIVLKAHEIFFA